MTQEDIIRMAREAGYGEAMSELHGPALERFAALVAAAEREACARVVEQAGIEGYGTLATAAVIRARSGE
jgi:hypothetical protein